MLTVSNAGAKDLEEPRVFRADGGGNMSMGGVPPDVAALAKQILTADMNPWLLSESKGARWMITRMTLVAEGLILADLSDGNGAESVLFDRDPDMSWNIIRRQPVGDWKPKGEGWGDRLSVLLFKLTEAEAAPSDGDKPSH